MSNDWRRWILETSHASHELEGVWPNLVYRNGQRLPVDEQGIVRQHVPEGLGVQFHEKMLTGTTLRELQYRHLHLAYWETPYYKEAIRHFLEDVSIGSSILLDLGCGDGRFTEFLIELGAKKVVAADCNLSSLASLASYAEKKGFSDRLLLVHSGADTLKLRTMAFDAVVAIGVLYYLNDNYTNGLIKAVSLLKPRGHLIASEPDMEGAAFKALVFETIGDFTNVFKKRRFSEVHDGETYRFRAFSQEEIRAEYTKMDLEILGHRGLSLLPSLLRIGMVRKQYSQEDIAEHEQDIRQCFDYYSERGKVFKHIIWHCRKRA